MKALALTNLYINRSIAFFAIMCTLAVFLYGFFLLEAVAHTASRTSAQRAITELQGKVGVLEGRYLAQSRTLTPEYAQELGFVAPTSVVSVYDRSGSPVALRSVR